MNISKLQKHLNICSSFTTDINKLSSDIQEGVSDALNSQNTIKETVLRIYLLRHYPYKDTPEWHEYEECLKRRKKLQWKEGERENNARIEKLGGIIQNIPEFNALSDELKKLYETIFFSPEKTALFFDLSKEGRAKLTGKNLSETFPSLWFVWHVNLPWSNKNYERWLSDADKVTEIKKAIQDVFDVTQWNYETIVIIGNRSYAEWFDVLKSDRDRTHEDNEVMFEEASYFQMDYYERSINHPLKTGGLQIEITPRNMEEITTFINRKEDNNTVMASSPQKTQNQVNRFFYENPERFGEYFKDPSLPMGLRVFCLANLTRLKDYSTIEKYYLSESTTISPEEKELFLQNIQDSNIKSILRKLFVRKEKLWADTDSKLFDTEFYSLLKNSRAAYNTAKSLQWNSLDPLINKWQNGAILDRELYFEEKEKSEQNVNSNKNGSQEKEIIVRRNFDPNMFRKGKYSRFIIRGHVGEGKSIYLSELVKKFSLEEDVETRFVRAKDFDDKLGILDGLFSNPNTFVCIDALDEAKAETREKIKSLFNGFTGRSIITTRHSEFFGPDEKACILYFNPIDTDTYIDSRFPKDWAKATELKEWIKSQGLVNEIQGNPLLLNLITLLASVTEYEKNWMGDYYILPFDQIKTKSDLYESVVRFILAKHQLDQKGGTWSETMLDIYMERLGKYAFDTFSGAENIKVDRKFFDTNLSILFKSAENGAYDFIHKSFYEFFLAKHLANMPNGEGNEKIYDFRNQKKLGNWNDWREFRPVVLFYGEMLAKESKWEELEEFLWEEGLMKDDDIFGEGFFMGLEILCTLSEDIRSKKNIQWILEKYEEMAKEWDIQKIIKKLNNIKQLAKNTAYLNLKIYHVIFIGLEKFISEVNTENTNYFDIITEIISNTVTIWTPDAIKFLIRWTDILINNNQYYHIFVIYYKFLEIWNLDAIKITEKIAEMLIRTDTEDNVYNAVTIYHAILSIWTTDAIRAVIRGIEVLENENKTYEASEIREAILEIWISKVIYPIDSKEIKEKEKNKKKGEVPYKIPLETENIIDNFLKYERENKYIWTNAYPVITSLQDSIQKAEALIEARSFYQAQKIYEAIIKIQSPQAFSEAMKWAHTLLLMKKFSESLAIYQKVFELPYYIPKSTSVNS